MHTPLIPADPAYVRKAPELLAPAGDWQCVKAAIENGADAIYFGLDCGFNARYRAQNFGISDLPELSKTLRGRGVKGYVTLNTLVFPSEMLALAKVVESIALAGIDAVLVQDFGVARLVRQICPELEIHASTQMSLTSAETIAVAADLGLSRVVVARELSIEEIRKITSATEMPIEIFIHGALCVAYSGQCLTSESLGGRSANRGQCAQACRLPYELVVDGDDHHLGDVKYLLSPQDLAGYAAIPDVIDAGVASIKIEGRLKTPEYVANIAGHYRRAIDEAMVSGRVSVDEEAQREMELSFSRGFSPGWLSGNDHKRLVPGLTSSKKGVRIGEVLSTSQGELEVRLEAPVSLGDGLAIAGSGGQDQQGSRIYSIADQSGESLKSADSGSLVRIGLGHGEIDWSEIQLDAVVYKNDDPKLNRRLRMTFSGEDPNGRQTLDMKVVAVAGQPLAVEARLAGGRTFSAVGDTPLDVAHNRPADKTVLREKLGRLGGTPFVLGDLAVKIEGQPMVPMAMLNQIRRSLVETIQAGLAIPPIRITSVDSARTWVAPIVCDVDAPASPKLSVLCRTMEQLESACRVGVDMVYADFHDVRIYRSAVDLAKDLGTPIGIATVRMQKPAEMGLLRVLTRLAPDVILARNLAAIDFARQNFEHVIADFSLNVTNHRSAEWLRDQGAARVTASYDLNREQLIDLVDSLPSNWLEVVMHQHMPMFHMEHCVFCAVISPGTNKTNCGRPCDRHIVQLRDRVGAEHPLQADVACRNTLYNATPQSGAEVVGDLIHRGVEWFRVEMLEEDAATTKTTLGVYKKLLSGQVTGREVWQTLNASNRLGVTRGTLETQRNPLAIL
ncbi:U32 family peptidase [Rubripirellula reticaptiva]|nr:U32 family peptidase [Rubripirellula reticaptiva]